MVLPPSSKVLQNAPADIIKFVSYSALSLSMGMLGKSHDSRGPQIKKSDFKSYSCGWVGAQCITLLRAYMLLKRLWSYSDSIYFLLV